MSARTTVLVCFTSLVLCACGRQRDVHLVGGYKLCPLENVPRDNYFIVNRDDETVVGPDVLQAWHDQSFIWGYVSPVNDPAFYPTSEGYFYIQISNGKFEHGISGDALRRIIPNYDDRTIFKQER